MPYIGRTLGQGTRSRFLYTATAGQTTFSGSDSQSNTLAYADNNGLDCFQNGVLLKGGGADYTATSGTSVVLTTGASVNDVIEILVYDVFAIADHVKKSGDAMTGALTNIDVNGTELILDSDGDTSITSDTDDQIDIKVGGSDKVTITTTGLGIGTSSPTVLLDLESTAPVIRFTDSDASGTPECEVSGAGGDLVFRADRDGEKSSSIIGFEVDGSERMRIDSIGKILLQQTSQSDTVTLTVGNVSSSNNGIAVVNTGDTGTIYSIYFRAASGSLIGSITNNGSNVSYNTSSDYRLKENVVTAWDATSRLKNLKPSRFNFKTDKDTTIDGFLAHEVSGIVPEAITGEKDAVDKDGNIEAQSIDQSKLVPLLTKALQEALARIETLEAKVTALESK